MIDDLLTEVKACKQCEPHLALGARPVLTAHSDSKILIVGQAPGTRVHATGVPWNDQSGKQLRLWLDVDDDTFYDTKKFSIIPMGFCYPGKGKSGDLPPRTECAPLWHERLLSALPNIELVLLIGQYAQHYYLKDKAMKNLTETVRNYESYLPKYFPLPHPSPRNRFWMQKNEWFGDRVVPLLQERVHELIEV